MRIHTRLTYEDMWAAARPAGVSFARFTTHGSRTHTRAFEVLLEGDSNRRPNNNGRSEGYAATWDQWGIFLHRVFAADPDAMCGNAKSPTYRNRDHFDWATDGRYDTLTLAGQHKSHRWVSDAPCSQVCKCGAVRRWQY